MQQQRQLRVGMVDPLVPHQACLCLAVCQRRCLSQRGLRGAAAAVEAWLGRPRGPALVLRCGRALALWMWMHARRQTRCEHVADVLWCVGVCNSGQLMAAVGLCAPSSPSNHTCSAHLVLEVLDVTPPLHACTNVFPLLTHPPPHHPHQRCPTDSPGYPEHLWQLRQERHPPRHAQGLWQEPPGEPTGARPTGSQGAQPGAWDDQGGGVGGRMGDSGGGWLWGAECACD